MNEFKSNIGKAGCHIENVGELIQSFDDKYVDVDGKVVKISGEVALKLMGDLFRKLQETFDECEGKEIQIEFGDSPTANFAEQLVRFILDFSGGGNAKA
jgi:hypothetical protein